MSAEGMRLQRFDDQFNITSQFGFFYGVAPDGATFVTTTQDTVKIIGVIALGALCVLGMTIYLLIDKKQPQQPVTIMNIPVQARPVQPTPVQSKPIRIRQKTNFDIYMERINNFWKKYDSIVVGAVATVVIKALIDAMKK